VTAAALHQRTRGAVAPWNCSTCAAAGRKGEDPPARVVLLRRRRPTSSALTLTSVLFVELPGIEPDALPGLLPYELRFRSVSVPFSPVRYLRFRSRVLTASSAVTHRINQLSDFISDSGRPFLAHLTTSRFVT